MIKESPPWAQCPALVNLKLQEEEQQLRPLRQQRDANPDNIQNQVVLAGTLHQLDFSFPDGGSRIPEAEQAYKWVSSPLRSTALYNEEIHSVHFVNVQYSCRVLSNRLLQRLLACLG